jgi:hypothetical protein
MKIPLWDVRKTVVVSAFVQQGTLTSKIMLIYDKYAGAVNA